MPVDSTPYSIVGSAGLCRFPRSLFRHCFFSSWCGGNQCVGLRCVILCYVVLSCGMLCCTRYCLALCCVALLCIVLRCVETRVRSEARCGTARSEGGTMGGLGALPPAPAPASATCKEVHSSRRDVKLLKWRECKKNCLCDVGAAVRRGGTAILHGVRSDEIKTQDSCLSKAPPYFNHSNATKRRTQQPLGIRQGNKHVPHE